jgi:tetratricopeptide (TPR) repeat protein
MSSVPNLRAVPTWRRTPRPILVVALAASIAAGSYGWTQLGGRPTASSMPAAPRFVDAPVADSVPPQPLADVDRAIGVWSANLDRDPADFVAATQLAELYLGRARLTSDAGDLERAFDASVRALDAHPDLAAARLLQAQVRLAQHDFEGARRQALAILADHPGLPHAIAALGDAELELGAYEAAAETYERLAAATSGPAVLARQARLESITGNLDRARALAVEALAGVVDATDVAVTEVAWYHTLEGSLAFQAGDLDAAAAAYRAAVDAWPSSAAALAGLARVRAAAGESAQAIELYRRSIAVAPTLDAAAALGDLLAATGHADEANASFDQVRALAALGLTDRQWALFLANHQEDPAQAVEVAAADLERRPDVYAHDAYAWALYAAGRFAEADAAMRQARAHDTEDAFLDYHAGMIAAALGEDGEARTLLAAALARNPGFDSIQAERAAATLETLETDR